MPVRLEPSPHIHMLSLPSRADNDTIWLGMGAPSRWAAAGYGISGAVTRFGIVTFHASASTSTPPAAVMNVTFQPTGSPGVVQSPTFVARLKSTQLGAALDPASVAVTGNAVLVSVDAAACLVELQVQAPAAETGVPSESKSLASLTGPGISFTVTGSFVDSP